MANSNIKISGRSGIGFYEVIVRVPSPEERKSEEAFDLVCGYLKLIKRLCLRAGLRQINDEGLLIAEFSFVFRGKKPRITPVIKAILERKLYPKEKEV